MIPPSWCRAWSNFAALHRKYVRNSIKVFVHLPVSLPYAQKYSRRFQNSENDHQYDYTLAQQPLSGVHKIPFLGHHYYILRFPNLSSTVEKRIFKESNFSM